MMMGESLRRLLSLDDALGWSDALIAHLLRCRAQGRPLPVPCEPADEYVLRELAASLKLRYLGDGEAAHLYGLMALDLVCAEVQDMRLGFRDLFLGGKLPELRADLPCADLPWEEARDLATRWVELMLGREGRSVAIDEAAVRRSLEGDLREQLVSAARAFFDPTRLLSGVAQGGVRFAIERPARLDDVARLAWRLRLQWTARTTGQDVESDTFVGTSACVGCSSDNFLNVGYVWVFGPDGSSIAAEVAKLPGLVEPEALLARATSEADPVARSLLVRELGATAPKADGGAIPAFFGALLRDDDPAIRHVACTCLTYLGYRSLEPRLREMAEGDPDGSVRSLARTVLDSSTRHGWKHWSDGAYSHVPRA